MERKAKVIVFLFLLFLAAIIVSSHFVYRQYCKSKRSVGIRIPRSTRRTVIRQASIPTPTDEENWQPPPDYQIALKMPKIENLNSVNKCKNVQNNNNIDFCEERDKPQDTCVPLDTQELPSYNEALQILDQHWTTTARSSNSNGSNVFVITGL